MKEHSPGFNLTKKAKVRMERCQNRKVKQHSNRQNKHLRRIIKYRSFHKIRICKWTLPNSSVGTNRVKCKHQIYHHCRKLRTKVASQAGKALRQLDHFSKVNLLTKQWNTRNNYLSRIFCCQLNSKTINPKVPVNMWYLLTWPLENHRNQSLPHK